MAAGLVLAVSEALEALVRNGKNPENLGEAIFETLIAQAKPFPFLAELMSNWLDDGYANEFRLDELRTYNSFLRSGEYTERQS